MSCRCTHLDQITEVDPQTPAGCGECMKIGGTWVHLRLCLSCGEVNCCDSSPNQHATAHFHESGHPLMQSFQPGEDWIWCYVDEVTLEPADAQTCPMLLRSARRWCPVGRCGCRSSRPL